MSTSVPSSIIGKKTFKIILLGDSGTGKTSIIQRFINNEFQEKENPTIGIDFSGKNMNYKGTMCRLQLWDTAGQQRFRSLIPSYIKDAICSIFVFDVSNPNTLLNIQNWMNLYEETRRNEEGISVLCGNKADLEKKYDSRDLQALLKKHDIYYYPISAKTGKNIKHLFYQIVNMINEHQLGKKSKAKKNKYHQQDDEYNIVPLTDKQLKLNSPEKYNFQENSKLLKIKHGKSMFCC